MSAEPQICTHVLDGIRCERHVDAEGMHAPEKHMASVYVGDELETMQWRDVDSTEQCDPIA